MFKEWQDAQLAKQAATQKADRAKRRKEGPPARYAVTELQAKSLKALSKCGFGTGTGDKRFVRDMQNATELTVRQGLYLADLVHRYRRQLKLTDSEAAGFRQQLQADANAHVQPEQSNADQPS